MKKKPPDPRSPQQRMVEKFMAECRAKGFSFALAVSDKSGDYYHWSEGPYRRAMIDQMSQTLTIDMLGLGRKAS